MASMAQEPDGAHTRMLFSESVVRAPGNIENKLSVVVRAELMILHLEGLKESPMISQVLLQERGQKTGNI